MHRKKIALTCFALVISTIPASIAVDPGIHDRCLEARDYEGCVKSHELKPRASEIKSDWCFDIGAGKDPICKVETKGLDIFGMKKPMGWNYIESEASATIYYWSPVHKITHNGDSTRYLGFKRVTRRYQNPEAGTSGFYTGRGSFNTLCSDVSPNAFTSSFSCRTSGRSKTFYSGKDPVPGGVRNFRFDTIYDCKDQTFASYEGRRLMSGGWEKASASNGMTVVEQILQYKCKLPLKDRLKLPVMRVQM